MNEPVKSNPAAACLHLLPVPTEPALPMGPGYTRIIAPRQNSKARGATNAEVDVPVRCFAFSLLCWRPLAFAAANRVHSLLAPTPTRLRSPLRAEK